MTNPSSSSRGRLPIRTLVLVALAATSLGAQQPARGRIAGEIRDSVHARPLDGAVVLVTRLEPRPSQFLSTVTDERGRYALDSLSAGRYSVAFSSALLDSLQLTIPPREVRLKDDERVRLDFALPSSHTLRMGACPGVNVPSGKGAIVGQVLDADADRALGGAQVVVTFTEIGVDKSTLTPVVHERAGSVRTDSLGQYHVCGVPTDSYVMMQVQHDGHAGSALRVTVDDEVGVLRRDLSLSAAGSRAIAVLDSTGSRADTAALPPLRGSAAISGTVRSGTGLPLARSQVRLLDAAPTAFTDSLGRFSLAGLPAGTQQLEVRHVGYQIARVPVELRDGRAVQQEIVLPRFAQLDTMRVVAKRSRYAEVQGRAKVGAMGHVFDEAEIAKRQPREVSDLLRLVTGFRIRGEGLDAKIISTRGVTSLQTQLCEANIVIDGMQHQEINLIPASDVGVVETYSGPAGAPPQYDSSCGVILIWTKR